MTTIYNTRLFDTMRDAAKLQARDSFPTQLADKIVPVMEVNPNLQRQTNIIRYKENVVINSNQTIYTTPTNQDFYLTSLVHSYSNSAISEATFAVISVIINGANQYVTELVQAIGSAGSQAVALDLTRPIKLDRGTNIVLSLLGVNVGSGKTTASIHGYIDEQSKA